MVQRIRLGELLVKAGVLNELQLRAALLEQRKWGGQLGKILVDMGFLEEALIIKALSKQLGIPRAQLTEVDVPQSVLARVDPNMARTHRYCPERFDPRRKTLVVAMVDPTDVPAIDDLAFRTGCRIETSLAGEAEISRAIERVLFGRLEEALDIEAERSFATMTGTEAGPFSDFDASKLGDVPSSTLRSMGSRREAPAPSPPAAWDGGARFGSLDLPEVHATPPRRFGPSETDGAPRSTKSAPPVWGEPSSSGQDESVRAKLEAAQKRQNRAIRIMMEMLIERGVFTEEELRARLGVPRTKR